MIIKIQLVVLVLGGDNSTAHQEEEKLLGRLVVEGNKLIFYTILVLYNFFARVLLNLNFLLVVCKI